MMKYTLRNGYIQNVFFGAASTASVEYMGAIPSGYSSLAEWAKSERINAWKIVSGQLVKDAAKESTLPSRSAYIMPDYLRNAIYPVGSIYMSVNSTDPSTFIGGTWERIKDAFLLSAGDTYTAGDTGGSSSASISIPNHNHGIPSVDGIKFVDGAITSGPYNIPRNNYTYDSGSYSTSISTMPPYLAVYVWKRIEDASSVSFVCSNGDHFNDINGNEFMVEV